MWRLTFLKTVIVQAFEVEAMVIACSLNFLLNTHFLEMSLLYEDLLEPSEF